MKKFSIFMLAALGLFAASCEDDLEPAQPQKNPTEPVLTVDNLAVEKAGALVAAEGVTTPAVKLEDYFSSDLVPAMKVVKEENVPTGGELLLQLQISKSQDFSATQSVFMTRGTGENGTESDLMYVPTGEWDAAHQAVFGKTDKPCLAYFRVAEYINLSGTNYRVNGPDYYVAEGTLEVSRLPYGYQVEENYFAFGNYVGNNVPANGLKMVHNEEADVYDDPVFQFFFEVSEDQAATGYTILVAPESVVNAAGTPAQCYGAGRNEGVLELGGQPIVINQAGPFKLEVNMETLTYSVSIAPKTLYVASTGATFNAKCLQLPTTNYINYDGMAYVNTHFRLTGQKGWSPVQYGAGDEKGSLKYGSADWIELEKGAHKGLYYMKVNTVKLTYEMTPVETLALIGVDNKWGDTDDIQLTPNKDCNVWTGEVTFTGASEFKIRANGKYDVDFGGAFEKNVVTPGVAYTDLVFKSQINLSIETPGTYEVVYDCSKLPNTLTLTAK